MDGDCTAVGLKSSMTPSHVVPSAGRAMHLGWMVATGRDHWREQSNGNPWRSSTSSDLTGPAHLNLSKPAAFSALYLKQEIFHNSSATDIQSPSCRDFPPTVQGGPAQTLQWARSIVGHPPRSGLLGPGGVDARGPDGAGPRAMFTPKSRQAYTSFGFMAFKLMDRTLFTGLVS